MGAINVTRTNTLNAEKFIKLVKVDSKALVTTCCFLVFFLSLSRRFADQLFGGRVTIKKVAADLGSSEPTLSRRLAEQGSNFDQLIDDIRKYLAMRYLDQGKLKLQELALLLGFSTHASFTSAFKRWTGKTPSETRSLS